jgi:hypothetical protein
MPIPGLDFGLFIAYILPGVVALYGLSLLHAPLREFLNASRTQPSIGGTLIVAVLAVAVGRIISIGRAAVIEPTFGTALPFVSCQGAPERGAIAEVAPDYRQLIDSGHREAFLLAVADEQRQYQFCGNTALAALLCMVCSLIALHRRQHHRAQMMWIGILCVVVGLLLYGGARVSYYSFMRAVTQVNGTEFNTFDRAGRPCRMSTVARLQ